LFNEALSTAELVQWGDYGDPEGDGPGIIESATSAFDWRVGGGILRIACNPTEIQTGYFPNTSLGLIATQTCSILPDLLGGIRSAFAVN
jgi:hypothetical protein